MSYIGNSPGVASQRVVTTFTATSGQTSFTPSSGYTLGYCDVYFNGVKLVAGDDYTAADGVSVVLATGAAANDVIEVVAHFPRGLSDGYLKSEADSRFLSSADSSVTTAKIAANAVTTAKIADANVTAAKMASGAAVSNIGYTPVNKAGDTITGVLNLNNATGSLNQVARLQYNGTERCTIETDGDYNYIRNKSGNGLRVTTSGFSDATTLQVDASGRVTTPYQPAFRARRTTSFVLSTTSANIISFDTADTNIGSHYNTGNGRFTAPVSGVYFFRGHVQPTGSGYNVQINFQKNGSLLSHAQMGWTSLPVRGDIAVETILQLSAGDYVETTVAVSPGGQTFDNHGVFFGYLIG